MTEVNIHGSSAHSLGLLSDGLLVTGMLSGSLAFAVSRFFLLLATGGRLVGILSAKRLL